MEPVGLAVGVVGLAGLFSACLDAVERFESWRNFTDESHFLHTLFETQKLRLKLWGRGVGLDNEAMSANHHEALDDLQTLSMVRTLLSDIEKLSNYPDDTNAGGTCGSVSVRSRTQPHASTFSESKRQKAKWVMGEKAKWTAHVERLKTLVQALHDLVPYDGTKDSRLMSRKAEGGPLRGMDAQQVEEECLRLFRLTTSTRDTTYESYKARVAARTEGTCQWFLSHEHFQAWLEQDFGPLLVTADPGCGKTVLAKYLTEEVLPKSATVCYFFFKENDQNTVRQALCAIIHQLFDQKRFLIQHAMPYFSRDGGGMIHNTESLWGILHSAVDDNSTGPVIVVLDALDECADEELSDLVSHLEDNFLGRMSSQARLKYLLTCRPYEQLISRFHELGRLFQNIHIPGADVSDEISLEIGHVIAEKVDKLSQKLRLTQRVAAHLHNRLQRIPHRTYLWVYLVFRFLEGPGFKKTPKGIDAAIDTLPQSINEAYEQVLSKAQDNTTVRRALMVIVAASRPLTLMEMNIALSIKTPSTLSLHDLDLEEDEEFQLRLQSWCGLFVSVHHGKVYLLHQTAREFLLAHATFGATTVPRARWHSSIHIEDAHKELAELCILYLDLFNSPASSMTTNEDETHDSPNPRAFLEYCAQNWGSHYREAGGDSSLVPSILRICSHDSRSFEAWFHTYWQTTNLWVAELTPLMIASHFGHAAVVELLLQNGAAVDVKDKRFYKTALMRAAETGQKDVIKLLLEQGADISSEAAGGVKPLLFAAWGGHCGAMKLLLENGGDVECWDAHGRSALSMAAQAGHDTAVELLLNSGAAVDSQDNTGKSPLLYAAAEARSSVIRCLLSHGADAKSTDRQHKGSLHHALTNHNTRLEDIMVLITHGAPSKTCDSENMTPLHYSVRFGRRDVAALLLETGVEVDIAVQRASWSSNHNTGTYSNTTKRLQDPVDHELGLTPLHFAAWVGSDNMVTYFLHCKANPNALSEFGETPLHLAITKNIKGTDYDDEWSSYDSRIESALDSVHDDYAGVITEIVDHRLRIADAVLSNPGININICDFEGECALHKIRYEKNGIWGSHQLVQKFLQRNAAMPGRTCDGRTPLHIACQNGDTRCIHLLASAEQLIRVDMEGKNALHIASESQYVGALEAVIRACQKHCVNLSSTTDNRGRNALHCYASCLIVELDGIRSLVGYGVDATDIDVDGETAASIYRHKHPKWSLGIFDAEVCQLLESYTASVASGGS